MQQAGEDHKERTLGRVLEERGKRGLMTGLTGQKVPFLLLGTTSIPFLGKQPACSPDHLFHIQVTQKLALWPLFFSCVLCLSYLHQTSSVLLYRHTPFTVVVFGSGSFELRLYQAGFKFLLSSVPLLHPSVYHLHKMKVTTLTSSCACIQHMLSNVS